MRTLALGIHLAFIVTGPVAIVILAVSSLNTYTIASYSFVLSTWPKMSIGDWAFLGILSAAFFLGVPQTYQIAPPQIIGTFDYG